MTIQKVIVITAIISLIVCINCSDDHSISNPPIKQTPFYQLSPDSVNIAILLMDFQTYEFEGGSFSHYPLCVNCDLESLPFVATFGGWDMPPLLFLYPPENDTIFFAYSVWMGTGRIHIPNEFASPESFPPTQFSQDKPQSSEYFNYWGQSSPDTLAETDTVWTAIQNLDIVNEFAKKTYRVGFYLYRPTEGVFDPNPAKWIVFLYRRN